jgi:branched-chain amino acid transport system substrate-binding protein
MVRTGERDYNSVLMRIQGKNPDVIVIINASVEGGYVVKQAKRLGIKAQLLGGMNLYSSETLTSAGEDAEGLYAVAYQFDPKFGTPKMKEFSANFEKRFGGFPPIITAVAFDAVMLYAEAAKQGAKSSDDIKKVVQGIKNYEGVSGTISFDSWSENMPTHRIMLVKGGQFVEDHVFEKFSEKDM